MAAVSLPSGPVTALHPETEMVEVEGWCHGAWEGTGDGGRDRERLDWEVTVGIIEEGGTLIKVAAGV